MLTLLYILPDSISKLHLLPGYFEGTDRLLLHFSGCGSPILCDVIHTTLFPLYLCSWKSLQELNLAAGAALAVAH